MTQEEFIEKFCPDYEKKMELIESELVQSSNPVYHAAIEDSMFTEALQNFTNKICEKQRMECAVNSILNAEQPKIEDL